METKQISVIDKIRKLMALSKSPNEHEAQLAAQRCQELLAEYNLSMAEVDAASTKANTPVGFAPRKQEAHQSAAMYKYQQDLMKAISKNNFCFYWIEERFREDPKGKTFMRQGKLVKGRWVKTHMLLGREENVIGTQVVYDYLVETMDRLLPYQGMDKRGKDALLWLAGCTESLVRRLDEERYRKERETQEKAKESAAQGGAALVVLSDIYASEDDLNNDARYGLELGTTARRRTEQRAKMAATQAEIEKLTAQGMSWDNAWRVANGIEPMAETPEIEESPAQRRKREAKEKRDQERSDARWERQQMEEKAKRNSDAFRGGSRAGRDINLDKQVKGNDDRRLA